MSLWRLWLCCAGSGCILSLLIAPQYSQIGPRFACWLIAALNMGLVRFWLHEGRRRAIRAVQAVPQAHNLAEPASVSVTTPTQRWWTDTPTRENIQQELRKH